MNTPDYSKGRMLQAAFCATFLLLMIPSVHAVDGYVKDPSNGCAIFKPNLKAGETVAFKGVCANMFGEGRGVAKWSASDGATVTFEGNFVQGKLQGNGKMTASGGDRYEGEYKDGKREGSGVYTSANGDRFNGHYKDNQRNGQGILTLATGSVSEGEWRNGNPVAVTSRSSSGVGSAGPKLGASQPSAAAPQVQSSTNPRSGMAGSEGSGTSRWSTPSLGSAQSQSASPTPSATSTQAAGSGGAAKIGQETRTASGAVFRVDTCGSYSVVVGVPPKSLDLRTSTPSSSYQDARAIDGAFPVVKEALELLARSCILKPSSMPIVFLFVNGMPPPGKLPRVEAPGPPGMSNLAPADYAKFSKMHGSWQVVNKPSDLFLQQEIDRRNREAAQQKQAQATAQRQQSDAKLAAFLRQHGAVEIPLTGILQSNPFSLEGKTIAITVDFESMNSPTVGMVTVLAHSLRDWAGTAVVSDIPKGTFLQPTRAFLAAKVIGLIPVQELGSAPHLKYVGVVICSNPNTSCP